MPDLFGDRRRHRSRRRVERMDGDMFFLNLHEKEIKVLKLFALMFEEEIEDTQNTRLYPVAHLTNSDYQDDFADLTQDDLKSSRARAITALIEPPSANAISSEELSSWLTSVNILHLTLGSKLEEANIDFNHVEFEELDDEEDRFQLAAYLLMTDMINEVSHSLVRSSRG